jgi:predicted AAA+ superfamily ATPase
MIERRAALQLRQRLAFYPAVLLLGPRHVGKTSWHRSSAAIRWPPRST